NADAIHPGYGFLAENAAFAQACEDAEITFIGPSPASIALMGSKIESRRAVAKYGVESVPGTLDPINADAEARSIAASVGYPIMIKASGGGGGKLQCRDCRIPRGSGAPVLLSGNEHQTSSRTSGNGIGNRFRPGPTSDSFGSR